MSPAKKGQSFRTEITDKMIADAITAALDQEHANIKTLLKLIERVTGISSDTASKWHKQGYAPKSRHLLTLAVHYPQVLKAIYELMEMGAIWQEILRLEIPKAMYARLDDKLKNWKKSAIEMDKFVLIQVRIDARKAVQLNQRQLWFLGQLQLGYKMQACDIVTTWHVHPKTAGRDIKGLEEADLIHP